MSDCILGSRPPNFRESCRNNAERLAHAILRRADRRGDADVALAERDRPARRRQHSAAGSRKPNILFIMGDDIGIMQPSIYHRGLMIGETPNIDRIGQEGAIFTHYYAEQSCTAGRNAFFTGMHPLRTGMIPPQLPGSPSYLRPGTPAVAKVLLDLVTNTGRRGSRNGVDFHLDMGASQFLSKQVMVGLVGYAYQQLTGDSGGRVGDFKSRVFESRAASGLHLPARNQPPGLCKSQGLQGIWRRAPA